MNEIDKLILEDQQSENQMLENYNILNRIALPTKIKKFPYNLLDVEVRPTYKEISLHYIKGKKYYVSDTSFTKRGGSSEEDILVFLY